MNSPGRIRTPTSRSRVCCATITQPGKAIFNSNIAEFKEMSQENLSVSTSPLIVSTWSCAGRNAKYCIWPDAKLSYRSVPLTPANFLKLDKNRFEIFLHSLRPAIPFRPRIKKYIICQAGGIGIYLKTFASRFFFLDSRLE